MRVEAANWSGEGSFTQTLVDRLQEVPGIEVIRVEDAPASRSEADYNFISNEIFVVFSTRVTEERTIRFGFIPKARRTETPVMTVRDLEALLESMADIGAADYSDAGMLQYLKTERVIPPYQTRGYKLIELVRVYEAGADTKAGRTAPPPAEP
jgi:hypothetical protein